MSMGTPGYPDRPTGATDAFRFVGESMAVPALPTPSRKIAPGFALDDGAMAAAALPLPEATTQRHYLMRLWAERPGRPALPGGNRPPTEADSIRQRGTTGHTGPRPWRCGAECDSAHVADVVRIAAQTRLAETAPVRTASRDSPATAAFAPMAHGTILNACDLSRNGIEIPLTGEERSTHRAAATAIPLLTAMLIDCPDPAGQSAGHVPAA